MSSPKLWYSILAAGSLFGISCLQDSKDVEVLRYKNRIVLADSLATEADSAIVTISIGNAEPIVEKFRNPLDDTLFVEFDASNGDEITISYQLFSGDSVLFEDDADFTAGTSVAALEVENKIEVELVQSSNAPSSSVESSSAHSSTKPSSAKASSSVPASEVARSSSEPKLPTSSSTPVVAPSSSLKSSSSSVTPIVLSSSAPVSVAVSSSSIAAISSSAALSSSNGPSSSSVIFDDTGVYYHGALSTSGNVVKDKNGANFTLRGITMGYFGLGDDAWWTDGVLSELKTKWKVNAIRLLLLKGAPSGLSNAAYIAHHMPKINEIIQKAIDHDLYVVIGYDEGSSTTMDPTASNVIFPEIAKVWGNKANLIYELWYGNTGSWSTVKTYVETILGKIRVEDPDNLVFVTTPNYSQSPDISVSSKLSDTKVVYQMGYDANSISLGTATNVVNAALAGDLPVISSDFVAHGWACTSAYNPTQAGQWLSFAKSKNIGVFAKILGVQNGCALLTASATSAGSWVEQDLSLWGKQIRDAFIAW